MADLSDIRAHAGHPVRVRLFDNSEFVGHLRTELLTDLSISVYLSSEAGTSATIYIEDISAISEP